jgi:UDP-N-acetylmuramoyl-tripeptide--D-alanyl-D-alanine ligase
VHVALATVLSVLLAVAYAAQMARWLRVLQREHYDPTSMWRFLARWTSPQIGGAKTPPRTRPRRPVTLSHALVLAMLVTGVLRVYDFLVLAAVLYGLFCPVGLSLRGRTGRLEWTKRLRTVAVVAAGFSLLVAALGALTSIPYLGAVIMVIAVPPVLDLAVRVVAPLEERRAMVFVEKATKRLAQVNPRVVAITGSYGKTSTKHHLAAILGADYGVVSSPRSYNNRAGLSRAVNESLAEGTRVFVAEMGTYGPGEIRALTSWFVPEIAVVTAIGPVHLERMKSLRVVEAAKREITERASVVVLNVDDPLLANWPASLRDEGKRVITAGSQREDVDVRVAVEARRWRIVVEGVTLGTVDEVIGVQPTNLACALAAAMAVGIANEELLARTQNVAGVAHRLNVESSAAGVAVIDDTYNANPASARAAIKVLADLELSGRRVVVTPGLVELGPEQYGENLRLGQRVAALPGELVAIGRTNALALAAGFERPPRRFDTRALAVAWARANLGPGDGVLFLNDLPDHYP